MVAPTSVLPPLALALDLLVQCADRSKRRVWVALLMQNPAHLLAQSNATSASHHAQGNSSPRLKAHKALSKITLRTPAPKAWFLGVFFVPLSGLSLALDRHPALDQGFDPALHALHIERRVITCRCHVAAVDDPWRIGIDNRKVGLKTV